MSSSDFLYFGSDPFNVPLDDTSGGYAFADGGDGHSYPTFTCPKAGVWRFDTSVEFQTGYMASGDTLLNDTTMYVGWNLPQWGATPQIPAFGSNNFFHCATSQIARLSLGEIRLYTMRWSSQGVFDGAPPSISFNTLAHLLSIQYLGE